MWELAGRSGGSSKAQISFSKSAIQEWRRLSTKKDSLFPFVFIRLARKGSSASVYLDNTDDAREAQDETGHALKKVFS